MEKQHADRALSDLETQASGWIDQLKRSERGTAALQAVSDLLWKECTWSLDSGNKMAVTWLIGTALSTPAVRQMVQWHGKRLQLDQEGSGVTIV